jgi:hypothetical protein
MPTVIAHHDVKDTQHWLSSPKREEVLGPLGASNIRTFVNQENPQQVAVLMDVDDVDGMMNAIANPSPDLVEAMEHDTVLPETMTILVES